MAIDISECNIAVLTSEAQVLAVFTSVANAERWAYNRSQLLTDNPYHVVSVETGVTISSYIDGRKV